MGVGGVGGGWVGGEGDPYCITLTTLLPYHPYCITPLPPLLHYSLRPHLIDFMFHRSGGSDFCSLQKKKKKWARSCACVRAPIASL